MLLWGLLLLAVSQAADRPRFVAVVRHHGSRTPLEGPPASWGFRWPWPQPRGQLTEKGLATDYEYGQVRL